jgi:hypothetical protein
VARVIAERRGPWIGTLKSSTPIYRVPADQPPVRVALDDPTAHWRAGLQSAFEAVPLPADAVPAAGADAHLTLWQPATDKLWEFFRLRKQEDGWHASWGGAMRNVSSSPGYYTNDSWPGSGWFWGATATSLPVAGGVITIDELRRGRIDHALALNIPEVRADAHSWPAQRSDGLTESATAIPEGARFRVDPTLDLDRLSLAPPARAIVRAAQRYGIVVRDKSSTVAFYAEDPTPTGGDPYPAVLGSLYPNHLNKLLAAFPWDRLLLLKMRLCPRRPAAPCDQG